MSHPVHKALKDCIWTIANPQAPALVTIPLAWSLIGFWAAISLGVTEDFGLLAAGLIGALLLIVRDQPDVCSVFN